MENNERNIRIIKLVADNASAPKSVGSSSTYKSSVVNIKKAEINRMVNDIASLIKKK